MTTTMAAVRRTLAEWTPAANLELVRFDVVRWGLLALIAASLAVLVMRAFWTRRRGLALPTFFGDRRSSWTAVTRHVPVIVALCGLPFLAIALADPRTGVLHEERSHTGRRISLMIDASSSMLAALPSNALAAGAPNDAAFFTSVGAARHFVELRIKGGARDLMSLIEFGDDAYVITPFTTDYDNILLSLSLIGDWNEFMTFPDQGTTIARAIDQAVGLFEAFEYLEASGNLMVLFTDGSDAEVLEDGRSVHDVLERAARASIPVFFIRTGADTSRRRIPDDMWRAAVARTGGRFFAATNESSIVRAIREIDSGSAGLIETRRYSTRVPRFAPFALVAVALWTLALTMRLMMPWLRTFS